MYSYESHIVPKQQPGSEFVPTLPTTFRHVTNMKMRLIDVAGSEADALPPGDELPMRERIPIVKFEKPSFDNPASKHREARQARSDPHGFQDMLRALLESAAEEVAQESSTVHAFRNDAVTSHASNDGGNVEPPIPAAPLIPMLKMPATTDAEPPVQLDDDNVPLPVNVVKKVGSTKQTLQHIMQHYTFPFNVTDDLRDTYTNSDQSLYRVPLFRPTELASAATVSPRKTTRDSSPVATARRNKARNVPSNETFASPAFLASLFTMKRLDPWYDEDSDKEFDRAEASHAADLAGSASSPGKLPRATAPSTNKDKPVYVEVAFGATKAGAEITLQDRYEDADKEILKGDSMLTRLTLEKLSSMLTDFTIKFPFRRIWGLDTSDDARPAAPMDSGRALMSHSTVRTVGARLMGIKSPRQRGAAHRAPPRPAHGRDTAAKDSDSVDAGVEFDAQSYRERVAIETNFRRLAADAEEAQRLVQSPLVAQICVDMAKLAFLQILNPRYSHAGGILQLHGSSHPPSYHHSDSTDIPRTVASILGNFALVDMQLAERKRTGYSRTRPVLLLAIRTVVESLLREIFPYHFLLEAAVSEYLRKYIPRADLVELVHALGALSRESVARGTESAAEQDADDRKHAYLAHRVARRGSIIDPRVTNSALVAVLLTWTPTHALLDSMIAALVDTGRYSSHVPVLEADEDAQKRLRRARHGLRRWDMVSRVVNSATALEERHRGARVQSEAIRPVYEEPWPLHDTRSLSWGINNGHFRAPMHLAHHSLRRLSASLAGMEAGQAVQLINSTSISPKLEVSVPQLPELSFTEGSSELHSDAALTGSNVPIVPYTSCMQEKYHATSGMAQAAMRHSTSSLARKFMIRGPKKAPALTEAALRPVVTAAGLVEPQAAPHGAQPAASGRLTGQRMQFTPRTQIMHSASSAQVRVMQESEPHRVHASASKLQTGGVHSSSTGQLSHGVMTRVVHRYERVDKALMSRDMHELLHYLKDGTPNAAFSMKRASTKRNPKLVPLSMVDNDLDDVQDDQLGVSASKRRMEISLETEAFLDQLHARVAQKPSVFVPSSLESLYARRTADRTSRTSNSAGDLEPQETTAARDDKSSAAVLQAPSVVSIQLPVPQQLLIKRGKRMPEKIFVPMPLDYDPPAKPGLAVVRPMQVRPEQGPLNAQQLCALRTLTREAMSLPPEPGWLSSLRQPGRKQVGEDKLPMETASAQSKVEIRK